MGGSVLGSEDTAMNKNLYLPGVYLLMEEKDNKSIDQSRLDGEEGQGKTLSNGEGKGVLWGRLHFIRFCHIQLTFL